MRPPSSPGFDAPLTGPKATGRIPGLAVAAALLCLALIATACGTAATVSRAGPSARQPAARPVAARPIAARPIAAQTPSCKPTLAAHLDSTGKATEVLTVESSSYATTHATATLWQRQGPCWVSAGGPWPARIGFKGFSNHHVEGDGTTPTGSYSLGPVVYGNAPDPGTHYTYHRLACGDWWDEDPSSPAYNSFQHVGCGQAPPFGGGSEALWTETRAYPSFAVVDYNTHPVVRGAGSGIFVHADIGAPTDGCVSLPLANLDTALRRLRPADQPLVVMGPASEITRF